MASRHASMLAATGVLLLALTACGGEGEPAPTTPAASTTASSETPTESLSPGTSAPAVAAPDPADYPGMDQQTEEGAKQAYRFYWATAVYSYQTGDIETLQSLQTQNCKYCSDLVGDVNKIHAAGGSWVGGSVADHLIEAKADNPTQVQVSYGFEITEHKEQSDSTARPVDEPSTLYGSGAQLVWEGGSWKVDGVDLDS